MSRLEPALAAARDTKQLELGCGVLARTPRVFRDQFGDGPAVIIGDPTEITVAGHAVAAAFATAGKPGVETIELRDPDLYAEYKFVDQVRGALEQRVGAIPVAVGS